jgi:hypothetical protein
MYTGDPQQRVITLATGKKSHSGYSHCRACSVDSVNCVSMVPVLQHNMGLRRGHIGCERTEPAEKYRVYWYAIQQPDTGERWGVYCYVRGYTVYRGENVLFQDSQNLGSQASLDMYTLT